MSERDRTPAGDGDEILTAYLDGEADAPTAARIAARRADDPLLAARLDHLASARLGIEAAYAARLEEAPVARLEAMLQGLDAAPAAPPSTSPTHPGQPALHPPRLRSRRRFWAGNRGTSDRNLPRPAPQALDGSRRRMLAAGLALFAAGALAGQWPASFTARDAGDDDWREVVAQYLQLYTPQTLDNLSTDADLVARQITNVGDAVGLSLDPATLAIAGAEFRRAQTFDYDDRPLAQFAYLDEAFGPMALCIVEKPGPAAPVRLERRLGFNVAFWSTPRHRFMLIGRRPAEQIEALGKAVAGRVGV